MPGNRSTAPFREPPDRAHRRPQGPEAGGKAGRREKYLHLLTSCANIDFIGIDGIGLFLQMKRRIGCMEPMEQRRQTPVRVRCGCGRRPGQIGG